MTALPASDARTRQSTPERIFLLTLSLAILAWFARAGVRPVLDPDAWLHLRIGAYLNAGGRFDDLPDPWTPFAERPYAPTQWGPERLGAWLHATFGLSAVVLLRTACALALLLALVWMCRQLADVFPATIAATIAFIGSLGALSERPQAAALVFLSIIITGWWRTVLDGRPRWWIIPLTYVLANVHGLWSLTILIGLLFSGVVLLDAGRTNWHAHKGALAIPPLSLLAAAFTPLGPALLLTPLQVTSAVGAYVQEWQPVETRNPLFVVAISMLLLILFLWVWSPGKVPFSRAIVLITALVCMLWAGRTIVVGVLLAAGLLAEAFQMARDRPACRRASRFEICMWLGLAAIVTLVSVPLAASSARPANSFPSTVTSQLRGLNSGTVLLSDHGISGWVMWESPDTALVIDLRSEIYPSQHIEAYVTTMAALPGWHEFMSTSGTTHALLNRETALAEALRDEGWTILSVDEEYILFERPSDDLKSA